MGQYSLLIKCHKMSKKKKKKEKKKLERRVTLIKKTHLVVDFSEAGAHMSCTEVSPTIGLLPQIISVAIVPARD